MPEDLETIYTAMDEIDAEVIRVALDAEGIQCFLENERQAMLSGCLPVKVQVRSSDVQRAQQFIERHEQSRDSQEE